MCCRFSPPLGGRGGDVRVMVVYCYAGVMPLHGFSSTMVVGVLRGGGDVRASLLIDNFPLWCMELPLMCLLGLVLKVPNEVFCLCIAIEHLAKTPSPSGASTAANGCMTSHKANKTAAPHGVRRRFFLLFSYAFPV